jgi:RNA polymerase sigma factor (sigma-70 family)
VRNSHPTPTDATVEAADDVLMSAYAHGDTAAFEQLYARHRAGLYRFVRRVLGTALAAQTDEVFQDTWLRVVQARASWAPQGASFKTWLYTLAHHRAIDLLRRSGREVSIDAFDGPDAQPWEPEAAGDAWQHWPAPASAAPNSDELAFWRRAGERLLACLDQLPLPQRSAFLLHHDDGMPLDDVASALDVGFETAKTRLRYAMKKLRTCMGAYLAPALSPAQSFAPQPAPRPAIDNTASETP